MYRVLLVDDEPIVLESLSSIIPWSSLGCELVGTSPNGMDAYNKICDDYPDIAIVDIKMPVLNGLELIERAKKLDANIDFIVLSGYDDFSFAQTAMQFGVKYYHLKPVKKEELIATLRKLVTERELKNQARLAEEAKFLNKLKLPLLKGFLFDAFHHGNLSEETVRHYTHLLLDFPEGGTFLCICSYLEPPLLSKFQGEFFTLLNRHAIPLLCPAFYVTNSFVFLYTASQPKIQELLSQFFSSRQYPGQIVTLEGQFFAFPDASHAFRELLRKISRYQNIFIISEGQPPEAVNNASLQVGAIEKDGLKNAASEYEVTRFLKESFSAVSDVESAILLCIRLLFSSSLFASRELDYRTLQYLFRSESVEDVCDIAVNLFLGQFPSQAAKDGPQKATLIPRVKEYVNAHLDSETLSLKWLAENLFFVSVGYLSKLFQQEEGEHFSYYLNHKRVELAKKFMSVYHNTNIQDIAEQVGFRNNPRYFSQVFKKHTGTTPSEYLLSLRQESQN